MLSPLGQRETKTYGMVNSTEVCSSLQDEFRQGRSKSVVVPLTIVAVPQLIFSQISLCI